MTTRIVGILLVRNEDLYVERAIRNVAAFCDRIHVADHRSTDGTWGIVRRLARELAHVDARQIGDAGESHRLVEAYAGTNTWVFGVDGDELYDPAGLVRLREELLEGAYSRRFRLKAAVLHCVGLADGRGTGYLSPPSRSPTKLYNFAAIDSWTGGYQRLHGGDIAFRPGYEYEAVAHLGVEHGWDGHFRCLHLCFVRRSSREAGSERGNLDDVGSYRRSRLALLDRLAGRGRRAAADASAWKREKYMRGELVEKDVSAFFPDYVSA